MKLLLVNPHPGRREMPVYPLGLATVAACMPPSVEVRGCDLQLAADPESALRAAVESFAPDVIGVSLRNVDSSASYDQFYYYPAFVSLVRRLRELRPGAALVAGGTGFSLFAEAIMNDLPELDFGVPLEGETAFPALLQNLSSPERAAGVLYRAGRAIRGAAAGQPADVARLPTPAYSLFPLREYVSRGAAIGVQTKRGCAFRCIYCTYPYLDGGPIRLRATEAVMTELEALAREDVSEIFFCDSIFNYPPDHAEELCRAMAARGSRWRWKAFFNERFVTEEQIALAKAAGCQFMIFGPDAGHPATLARYHKTLDLPRMEAAYEACRRAGLGYKCAFMMNGPGETPATLLRMFALIARQRLRSKMDFSLSTMRIYPHTQLHEEALRSGQVKPGDPLIVARFYNPYPLKPLAAAISAAEKAACRILRRF